MSQTLSLYRLQMIDSQIDRTQSTLQNILKKLEDDATLREVRQQVEAADTHQRTTEQNRRAAEAAVTDQRIKIEQTESSLYSGTIHNPKELQDLQNDVVSLKRQLAVLEDTLLEIMLGQDESEKTLREARASLEIIQAQRQAQNQNLGLEQDQLQKELLKLATERAALADSISNESVSLYNQLRQDRRGVAVTTIIDDSCAACGSHLTPALVQASRSAGQVSRCPSCNRILYGS
jgi:predicted  nucleic acid-binding Zn-ribbon protein